MATMMRWVGILSVGAVMTFYATAALAQAGIAEATGHHSHTPATTATDGVQPAIGADGDLAARMAALDTRIEMLAADMHMFVGEIKIQAMAELLTAMIERQSLMREAMRPMRHHVMDSMMGPAARPPAGSAHEEHGAMCAPAP